MKRTYSSPMLAVVFFLLFWSHLASPLPSQGGSNATDQLALLSFKSLISVDPWRALASWNDSLYFCRWRGVTCGDRHHPDRVTALDLDSLDLTGSISPSLANLTSLVRIHLPSNRFHGGIPQALGRVPRLQHLNLSTNSLQGFVPPTLFLSPNLRNLSLRGNQLQGEIAPPPSGNHSTLTNLDLSNNMFTGSIPPSLGNISSLSYLDLSNNSLTGGIPSSVGKLGSIAYFDMARNNLTGEIPTSLWNLSFLTVINVHTNNLSGTIPPDFGLSLPRLRSLLMYENQFSGAIPSSISNASRLQSIQLYYNQFSGTIPRNLGALQGLYRLILGNNLLEAKEAEDWSFFTGLTNCTDLLIFDVSNNRLEGTLPDSISNMSTKLTWFGMMGNQISGRIPPGIANLVSLTQFRIKDNLLTGNIPPTIGRLQRLNELSLAFNLFSGEIPATIGNLTQLNLLYLEGNNLSGNIPTSLGNCRNLNLLNLEHNKLTGTIPAEVVSISSISIYLSFSDNLLTGSLPSEVGRLGSLDALNVAGNKLSGEIPSTLGECQSLEYLFMERNLFQGTIPSSLSVLKGLLVLDLSTNNMSGEIPKFLEDFPYLENLNLSFNNFAGEVPKNGAFANASYVSVLGNIKLCGGNPSLHLPNCSTQLPTNNKHSSSSLHIIILVSGVVVCFIVLFCLVATCYCVRKSRRKSSITKDHMNDSHMRVTYGDLVKATDAFSTTNLIGVGGFGSVYKGILDDDDDGNRKVIAVKVLNLQKQGASKSFMAECEALRNIRHRNLVKIITACSGVDFGGNDFKALIFEFMPNGSLEKWLHPELQEQEPRRSLSLIQRLNIAIDVASALDYLHHHGGTAIVHCDLKPSNVLLDNDMVAHVGDFGLARFLDPTVSKSSQQASSSIVLKGTIGYAAPEYGTGNKISTEGDVYSYGVLLLEMFTGKRPNDDDVFKEGINIHKFVEMAMPEGMMDIVDEHILLTQEDGEANTHGISGERVRVHECLTSVLEIGLLCTQELPRERMKMGDVSRKLMATKEAFLRDVIREQKRT